MHSATEPYEFWGHEIDPDRIKRILKFTTKGVANTHLDLKIYENEVIYYRLMCVPIAG